MKLVVFGLSISSSWGNGHATLWRGLCRALARRGHHVIFFERDVPYYAAHRDLVEIPGCELVLYPSWDDIAALAGRHLAEADAGMVTSYCPDGLRACEAVLSSRAGCRVFYDLDTPITLEKLKSGEKLEYLPPGGLSEFDMVLSYTGGSAVTELKELLGARRVAPLYGSVDPAVHHPVETAPRYACDLSYLGTYAADRQPALETLFLEPARRLPERSFVIAGSLYPEDFPWEPNVRYVRHLPPADHAAFYCSSTITLNVTRKAMAELGYCPSGRLFEAAACGAPVMTDEWQGLDLFFEPGVEIMVARTTAHAMEWLETSPERLNKIARAGRERALESHTADVRALELETILERARSAVSVAREN